ncbi:hypothetical protein RFI_23171, partial [Reticulomyxa filosa]
GVADTKEAQIVIDEAVITLLHPDFFNLEKTARRELLRKHEERVKNWPLNPIDEKIIRVADCISMIDRTPMVDGAVLDQFDEESIAKEYQLKRIELEEVQDIPRKYFEQDVASPRDDPLRVSSVTEALGFDSDGEGIGLGSIGALSGKTFDALAALGSQGRVEKAQVQKNNRDKDCFMAFKCEKTSKIYVFHDYLCVKLRRMKEAIRRYVFNMEMNDSTAMDRESLEAVFISIDVDENVKQNSYARPQRFTTPRRGDHNYTSEEKEVEEDDDDIKEAEKEKMRRRQLSRQRSTITVRSMSQDHSAQQIKEAPLRHEAFRRYRTHVSMVLERLDDPKRIGDEYTYNERYGDLPKIVLYCDLNEFGVALWEFIAETLKSKFRISLWKLLQFLALEMGTMKVLDLLQRHTYLMAKHTLDEGISRIGQAFENIAKKLLKEIESEHLFALLVLIPTDIDQQSIIDLALQYELINFLEEPRIVHISNAVWSVGSDFLRPEFSFQDVEMELTAFYTKLWNQSGSFYYSPVGKFATSSTLYLLYLALFSYVTWTLTYNYTQTYSVWEFVLWISSAGYVANEVLEFVDAPDEYFASFSNYWDVLIAFDWIALGYLRFGSSPNLVYNTNGQLDENQTRNEKATEIYMFFWSVQSVLLWSRVVKIFQISRGTGPLIRMIINMLSDVTNFGLISILFLIGITFAMYYIIGTDLEQVTDSRLGTLSSVGLYIFQTILGQQSWSKVDSVKLANGKYLFDVTRSNLALSLIFFFSVFGTILLINLLIAMMTNTFESVKERSNTQLNKQRIETTFELDHSRAVAPPPLNVFALILYLYWMAFELITWVLTFGHRQFNEEFMAPLNKQPQQYNELDAIVFMKGKEKIQGKVVRRRKCVNRIKGRKHMEAVGPTGTTIDGDASENWDCIVLSETGTTYHVLDSEIIRLNKQIYKRRSARIPSTLSEVKFCRYCRYNLTNDRMHIDYYLQLFDEKGISLDPVDKQYMRDLLSATDRFGVPIPRLCEMCPNCYRPFKVENGETDTLNRAKFILEVVSYIAFKLVVWPTLLIVLFMPANVARFANFLSLRFATVETEETQKQKFAKFRTEGNDEYRNRVKNASTDEEEMGEVVKRIDNNVQKLETALLGLRPRPDAKDAISSEATGDRDEFDVRIDKMRAEMNRRFEEINNILAIALQRQQQAELAASNKPQSTFHE